jgi:hypothetical protein
MNIALFACILVVVTLLVPGPARAQSPQPKVFGITLREDPNVKPGHVGAVEGVTDQKGHRFLVENLDVLQPIAVTLVAREPSRPLKLQLIKYDWDKPDRSGVTDTDGVVTFRIRTQREMKILVTSETPQEVPYYLVIWIGDEIQPEMGKILVPRKGDKQRQDAAPRD